MYCPSPPAWTPEGRDENIRFLYSPWCDSPVICHQCLSFPQQRWAVGLGSIIRLGFSPQKSLETQSQYGAGQETFLANTWNNSHNPNPLPRTTSPAIISHALFLGRGETWVCLRDTPAGGCSRPRHAQESHSLGGFGLEALLPQQEADGKKSKLGLRRQEAAHLPGCGPGPQVVRSAVEYAVPKEGEQTQPHSA